MNNFFKHFLFMQPAEKFVVALGPMVAVDAIQVSAVYPEDNHLIIRIDGKGVIRIHKTDLYNSDMKNAANNLIKSMRKGNS